MRKGDVTPMWLPAGKFVTRWKEDIPSASSAIVASSESALKETLAAKFGQKPGVMRRIGLFQFLGWADEQELEPAARGMRPAPLVSFAQVLSRLQIRERLTDIMGLVESVADAEDGFYVEVFVRGRELVEDDELAKRFKRKGGRRR